MFTYEYAYTVYEGKVMAIDMIYVQSHVREFKIDLRN